MDGQAAIVPDFLVFLDCFDVDVGSCLRPNLLEVKLTQIAAGYLILFRPLPATRQLESLQKNQSFLVFGGHRFARAKIIALI